MNTKKWMIGYGDCCRIKLCLLFYRIDEKQVIYDVDISVPFYAFVDVPQPFFTAFCIELREYLWKRLDVNAQFPAAFQQ